MDKHAATIGASIKLHRALYKLRAKLGKDTKGVLAMVKSDRSYDKDMEILQSQLMFLQSMWPRCSHAQCVDIATTVMTAASLSLNHALGVGGRPEKSNVDVNDKPWFFANTSAKKVVRETLQWMFRMAGREALIGPVLDDIIEDIHGSILSASRAHKLRDKLIQNMPGILQWADEHALAHQAFKDSPHEDPGCPPAPHKEALP
jgi:hypothetical protein